MDKSYISRTVYRKIENSEKRPWQRKGEKRIFEWAKIDPGSIIMREIKVSIFGLWFDKSQWIIYQGGVCRHWSLLWIVLSKYSFPNKERPLSWKEKCPWHWLGAECGSCLTKYFSSITNKYGTEKKYAILFSSKKSLCISVKKLASLALKPKTI